MIGMICMDSDEFVVGGCVDAPPTMCTPVYPGISLLRTIVPERGCRTRVTPGDEVWLRLGPENTGTGRGSRLGMAGGGLLNVSPGSFPRMVGSSGSGIVSIVTPW